MNDILKSTPEEEAYHAGWLAFFNERDKGIFAINPYDKVEEETLFKSWENGKRSAETVAFTMIK